MSSRGPTRRVVLPVMLQRWHEISFFHWSCEPAFLQRRLPSGLEVDTFDGKAWISLTPFLLRALRPPLAPHYLGMNFPEMNLRTYVNGPAGSAIWFFSLDAASLLAVAGARITLGLPYFWSNMRVEIGDKENFYISDRGGRVQARIRIAKEQRIIKQSDLDIFLTARFRLYSIRRGRLLTAEVQHPPWVLNRLRVLEFEENVRRTMGVESNSNDFLCHHSPGVETKIGIPHGV